MRPSYRPGHRRRLHERCSHCSGVRCQLAQSRQDSSHKLILRRASVRAQVGDWYVLDVKRNGVVREDVNLEAIARECGALKDWEVVS